MTENPASPAGDPVIKIANEFTEVEVGQVRTRNGVRLRIFAPSSGREILLCPLELEALTWQDHGLFSHLLATPGDPAGPPGGEPGAVADGDSGAAG